MSNILYMKLWTYSFLYCILKAASFLTSEKQSVIQNASKPLPYRKFSSHNRQEDEVRVTLTNLTEDMGSELMYASAACGPHVIPSQIPPPPDLWSLSADDPLLLPCSPADWYWEQMKNTPMLALLAYFQCESAGQWRDKHNEPHCPIKTSLNT